MLSVGVRFEEAPSMLPVGGYIQLTVDEDVWREIAEDSLCAPPQTVCSASDVEVLGIVNTIIDCKKPRHMLGADGGSRAYGIHFSGGKCKFCTDILVVGVEGQDIFVRP